MAKIVEIYVPQSFKRQTKWIPPEHAGKVIEFPAPVKRSA